MSTKLRDAGRGGKSQVARFIGKQVHSTRTQIQQEHT
jgi:hypothetical protein